MTEDEIQRLQAQPYYQEFATLLDSYIRAGMDENELKELVAKSIPRIAGDLTKPQLDAVIGDAQKIVELVFKKHLH